MNFIKKIPAPCLTRLSSYAEEGRDTSIISYCSALYDFGILNMQERVEASYHFRKKAFEKECSKK